MIFFCSRIDFFIWYVIIINRYKIFVVFRRDLDMSVVSRDFDNVAHIQDLIRNCENKECKLKNIIEILSTKREDFLKLERYHAEVCNAREKRESYESSFIYKYLRFLPQVRDKFRVVDSEYESSLSEFRKELVKMDIVDERSYKIKVNNINRHYARIGEFEDKLKDTERDKNKLIETLKNLNVRVLEEYLFGLPKEVLGVVKNLPSEQVLVLKDLNLPRIDYKSLLVLYNEYSVGISDLRGKYLKASNSLANFSNVSRAISLYKKACLNRNVLSAADGKMLVGKVKAFMLKHKIKNIDEVHERQLELKKEIEETLQKMDDMSTKREKILPLLNIFGKDIGKCNKIKSDNIEKGIITQ